MKKAVLTLIIIIAPTLISSDIVKGQTSVNSIRFGSTGNPLTGLTISWNSSGTADSIAWGYSQNMEFGRFAGLKSTSINGTQFDFTFPELAGDSTINYALFDSNIDEWTEKRIYQTAANPSTNHFSFTVFGDSRSFLEDWQSIAEATLDTDFTLFTGDIVNDGNVASDWNNWLGYGKNFVSREIIYHCIGNHDGDNSTSGFENFRGLFTLPENELYYSFCFGNTVIICLNSERADDNEQNNWLLTTLDNNRNKTWKIVFFHSPFYTSPTHIGEMDEYFDTWWKAFDDYGIDLVFNGHTHNYLRTKPINRNISINSAVEKYGDGYGQGRCQIVAGNAGAPLVGPANPDLWWLKESLSTRHFCNIDIDGAKLKVQAMNSNRDVFDEFILDKNTEINFQVDLNNVEDLYSNGDVWLNLVDPDNSLLMEDFFGENIYSCSLEIPIGTELEYYFSYQAGSNPETDINKEIISDQCCNASGYRFLTAPYNNLDLPAVLFGYCISNNPITRIISIPIISGKDDAEEVAVELNPEHPLGQVDLSSSNLELYCDSEPQYIGLLFRDIQIPAGATVTNAYVQFTCHAPSEDEISIEIFGAKQATVDSLTNINFSISNYHKTESYVSWSPEPQKVPGDQTRAEQTSNIGSIINEIISLDGWKSGNNILIIFTGDPEQNHDKKREFESFEGAYIDHGDARLAPELVIRFEYSFTHISEIQSSESIQIFPNPTSGIINITGHNSPANIKIYNLQGQLLKSLQEVQTAIDLSYLKPGIYILNIHVGNQILIKKIVKD